VGKENEKEKEKEMKGTDGRDDGKEGDGER
jgi:hypothetical protein